MIVAHDPRLHALVDPAVVVETLVVGPEFMEGPVWLPAAGVVIFSDIPGDTCYRWSDREGLAVHRRPTGKANGMTLDREGRIIVCEHATSVLSRLENDGSRAVLAETHGGLALNSPNDVVVRADGWIYFTDPPYGREAGHGLERPQELTFQGIFRHAGRPGAEPELLDRSLRRPNGLTFSPDGTLLYVSDTELMAIFRFDVQSDGTLGPVERFALLVDGPFASMDGFPDGLKVDEYGNVWSCGPGGIWVFDPAGRALGQIQTPRVAANFTWGGADGLDLFITANDHLLRVPVLARRAALHAPAA